MLVSVIIPNYNYARSLGPCIDAALGQSYAPLEVIVVDDCSTDGSATVARSRGVRVLQTPRNSGVALARNMGAAVAAGEILFFVDSDVALAPDAVERAVAELTAHPEYGAVCGIYEDEPLIDDGLIEQCRILQAYGWRMASLGEVSFLFSSLAAIPRTVFDEIGPFNERLRHTEEVDYGQRMSARYPLLITDTVRGWHDDDDKLYPLLRKLYTRARLRVPLFVQRRTFAKGFETPARSWSMIGALLSLLTLPLLLLSSLWMLLPAALLGSSVATDAGMYRYVLRRRGPAFLALFTAVAFLTNVAIATGIAVGAVHWLVSDRFRRLYQPVSTVEVRA